MIKITTINGELKEHREIISRLHFALQNKEFGLLVIFPTLSLLNAIRDEFLVLPEVKGCGGFRFLLFEGFIQEISLRFGLNQRKPSPLEREILITECFRKLTRAGKLAYLNRIPYNGGYRRAILDGIDEWTRSGLTPEFYEKWAQAVKNEKERHARAGELALIYKTYKDLVLTKGMAEEDKICAALKDLKFNRQNQTSRTRALLYGFTDLTPLQKSFLETLTPLFEFEILIDHTSVIEFQDFITQRFADICEITSLPSGQSVPVNMLAKLQQWFWTREPAPSVTSPEDESIQLLHTAGLHKAAQGIAREIVKLMRDNPDYKIDDFLILAPQTQSFCRRATPVFSEYNLPLNKTATPLREFPSVSHLLQSFIVCAEDWPWPQMEILIRQCYQGEFTKIGDRLIPEIGERYGALSGQERWRNLIESNNFRAYFTEIGLDILPLLKVSERLNSIPASALLKDYLKIARDWFNIRDVLDMSGGNSLRDQSRLQIDNLLAVQSLLCGIDAMLVLMEDLTEFQSEINCGEFINFFKEHLLVEEISEPSPLTGPVIKIIPPREARGLRARFVFITGLEQGTFPRLYINDWKLTAGDRHELRKMGIGMETGEQYQLQERFVFYWALQTATERLYLVNQDQDENGQPLTGSIYLDEILQWFPGLRERAKNYILAPQLPSCFEECLSPFESNAFFAYKITDTSETVCDEKEKSQFKENINIPVFRDLAVKILQWQQPARKRPSFNENPDALELVNQIFHKDFVFSITALEDYQTCPFRFYIKHLLKVKPIIKPQLMPDGLQLGNLYHEILQEFGETFRGQSFSSGRIREYRQALADCFNNYYREWQEKAANDLVRLVLLIQENIIRQALERWLVSELEWADESRERFKMSFLELAFGMVKGDFDAASLSQPYQLEIGESVIKLWGKVDRVDVDDQGNFIVYDYKSSKGPATKDLLALKNLQIPVYILALEQLIFGKDKAVGGSYLGLRAPSRSRGGIWSEDKLTVPSPWKSILPEKEWREWLEAASLLLANIVQTVRRGEFPLAPDECLSYCEYKNVCRYQEREVERFGHSSAE